MAEQSFDDALWPCAWLVHDAVSDPDPAVQQFGGDCGRRGSFWPCCIVRWRGNG